MRVTIDEHGRVVENVCCNCNRTLPEGSGDFCGKCDTADVGASPREPKCGWLWLDRDKQRDLALDWLDASCRLTLVTRYWFSRNEDELKDYEPDRLEAYRNVVRAALRFAQTSVPCDSRSHDTFWSEAPKLFEAACCLVLRYDSLFAEESINDFMLSARSWYNDDARRHELEEQDFRSRN